MIEHPVLPSAVTSHERPDSAVRRLPSRFGHLIMGGIVVFLFAYMFVPLIVVVGVAFNRGAALNFPPHGLSLHWFRELVADPQFRVAFSTSLKIASTVGLISIVVGTGFAFAATRRTGRLVGATTGIAMAPVLLPGIFIGVALFSTFLLLGIRMSAWTAVAGQLIYVVPFVILILDARLRDFDLRLEDAARTLGYTRLATLVLVTIRIILPPILAAFLLAFATSLDEFFITYWVIGQGTTLPIYILSRFRTGIDPRMNAVATLLLIVPLAFVIGHMARRVFQRHGRP